ncbi:MAG TPA: SAM-dependent methyltransferase [Candidatus Aquilonibacter sp.]|nr:SAM-dependent methyltransferase [Candidatus Aquilonibacter sp.]
MPENLVENVSDTAFWIAHYRALETQRPHALFRDPLAERLAGNRGGKIAAAIPMGRITAWMVAIRTTVIDSYITRAIAEGVDTILNLGAGLDTRPYRMNLPSTLAWIEADYPQMIDYKEKLLATESPRCRLDRVRIDLADDEQRRKFLANVNARAKKLLVLTEGVITYLTNDQVAALADDLHSLANLRYWIVEYFSPDVVKFRQRTGIQQKLQNAPFRFKPGDWFGFFAQRGWRPEEIRYLPEEGRRLGRPVDLPILVKILGAIRSLFSSPAQRELFRRFSAYMLLVRTDPHSPSSSAT